MTYRTFHAFIWRGSSKPNFVYGLLPWWICNIYIVDIGKSASGMSGCVKVWIIAFPVCTHSYLGVHLRGFIIPLGHRLPPATSFIPPLSKAPVSAMFLLSPSLRKSPTAVHLPHCLLHFVLLRRRPIYSPLCAKGLKTTHTSELPMRMAPLGCRERSLSPSVHSRILIKTR